ncbi:DUF4328 domain-containing protein [Nocardia vinacea]|uniref:DUF4328 domain-containing protein n=1 Tax=Nocardia vinacea TaxID=96468 RepID=A0ABZ1Z3G6_9NOCA|nr:DUF4328 domain-containing protein [Nocardia vinacea]
MSTVVQPCARCGARWAVQTTPMHWCPRCRGVLLSPAPIDAPAERRNYRWVARRPDQRSRKLSSGRPRPPVETPRYQQIPRWGLLDPPVESASAPQRPLDRLTNRAGALLMATAAVFAIAACAELGRYLILLRNRTRLIPSWLLHISDAMVWLSALVGLALGLITAIAMLGWLIETRRAAFAAAGRRDPRLVRTLALGCLIPVVNLLWPGVFLTETVAVRPDPRTLRAVRIWWVGWVLGAGCTVAALLWRTADTLQAKADGVLFTAFTDLVAAGVAVLTLWVQRSMAGRDLFGRSRTARRWVIAVDPAVPVIEPVQPGGGGAKQPEPVALEASTPHREHEEVLAK